MIHTIQSQLDLDAMQMLLDQLENVHKQLEMKGLSMTKTTDVLIACEVCLPRDECSNFSVFDFLLG